MVLVYYISNDNKGGLPSTLKSKKALRYHYVAPSLFVVSVATRNFVSYSSVTYYQTGQNFNFSLRFDNLIGD